MIRNKPDFFKNNMSIRLIIILCFFMPLVATGNTCAQMTETEKQLLLGRNEITLNEYYERLYYLQSRLNSLISEGKTDTAKIRSQLRSLIAFLPYQSKIIISYEDDDSSMDYRVTVHHGWFIDHLESIAHSDTAKPAHLLLLTEQVTNAGETAGFMIEIGPPPVPESYKPKITEIKSRDEFLPQTKKENRNLLYDFFKWLAEQLEKLFGKLLPHSAPEVEIAPAVPQGITGISQILLYVFYAIGGVLLLYIIFRLARLYLKRKRAEPQDADELISSLLEPGEPAEPDYHLNQAELYASKNDYRRALRHLVLSVLLYLDKKDIIRMIFSRTNQEYLDSITDNEILPEKNNLTGLLAGLFFRFDRTWYGFKPIDREKYELCLQASEKIRKLYGS